MILVLKAVAFFIRTIALVTTTLIIVLACLYASKFWEQIKLPNGMIIKREFDHSELLEGRSDLYTSDKKVLIARGVALVCFDDQFVEAYPHGVFIEGRIEPLSETSDHTPYLSLPDCAGYFTEAVPADWLYSWSSNHDTDGWGLCGKRNTDNSSLRKLEWRTGPCNPFEPHLDPLGRRSSPGSPAQRGRNRPPT